MMPQFTPFKFKPLHEYLTDDSSGPITLQSLSELLKCKAEQLKPLLDHNYFRIVFSKEPFSETVIARPTIDAIEWLRLILAPFHEKPIIKLSDLPELFIKYTDFWGRVPKKQTSDMLDRFRRICFLYNIAIYPDPVFGELLTVEGFHRLMAKNKVHKKTLKKDRAGLFAYLLNTLPSKYRNPDDILKAPTFSVRLSKEINRIAHLPIEQRTILAMELIESWRDARALQECLVRMKDLAKYLEKDYPNQSYGRVRGKTGMRVAEVRRLDGKFEALLKKVIENSNISSVDDD